MKPALTGRRLRASPPAARTAAAVISMAALALLTGACGGGGHAATTSATSDHERGTLAYARCMRSHGVPNFPDPNSSGSIDKAKVSSLSASPQFRVAEGTCRQLLPNTSTPTATRAEVQAALNGMVRFAACMRSHGVQSWPDPQVDRSDPTDPRPVFDLHNAIDPQSPGVRTDIHECQHLMPQSVTPYMCSRASADRIPGSPPGAEGCVGGSARVP